MAAPKLDTSSKIEWKNPAADGSFYGTKKVTAEIGGTKKCYIIKITKATSKEKAEELLAAKIHELVSVALMVNVTTEKSLHYKDGKYSTETKNGKKQLEDVNKGFSDNVVKKRKEKAEQRETILKKIQNAVKGKNSDLDKSVKAKISKKNEKLTLDDLKKIYPEIKSEHFKKPFKIPTAEKIDEKMQSWKLKKELADHSLKLYNLKKAEEKKTEEKKKEETKPTPEQMAWQGLQLISEGERDKGVALLKQAAKDGHLPAERELCRIYIDNKDLNNALIHGLKAADGGDMDCQNVCIKIYAQQGKLAEKIALLKKGIDQESPNPYAHFIMAGHYIRGEGVVKSDEQALEHYRKVIEHKDNPSLNYENVEVIFALTHLALGQKDEAKQILEKADAKNEAAKKLLQQEFPAGAAPEDDDEGGAAPDAAAPKVVVPNDDDDAEEPVKAAEDSEADKSD